MSKKSAPPPYREAFAARLKSARIMAGYEDAKSFAEAIGSASETYRRWERGETEPNIQTLAKISAVTGLSLDYLIAGLVPRGATNGTSDTSAGRA